MKPIGQHIFLPSNNPRQIDVCVRCGRKAAHPCHRADDPIPRAA